MRWVFVALSWGLAQIAFAQAQAVPQGSANIPASLVQKQALARSLIEDASAAGRIQASQDAEALRLFALAKDSYASAITAMKVGNYSNAEKQLNEAMVAMSKARQQVPDAAALAVKQRVEYEEKLKSVESLKKSYLGYLKSSGQKSGKDKETEESANLGINRLMDAARKHAAENQLVDALRALEKAEQVMRAATKRVLGSTQLDYTPKFETPAEEYAYELERNRSYLELIPVAIAEFNPTDEAKKNVVGLVERNRLALDQAREYAGQKEYRQALASVHTGTGYLLLALTAAGLVVPQETKADQK